MVVAHAARGASLALFLAVLVWIRGYLNGFAWDVVSDGKVCF
jgi:hypothetical protein